MQLTFLSFSFPLAQIPPTIKKLPKLLEAVGKVVFTELLACALDDLSGTEVTNDRFAALYTETLTEVRGSGLRLQCNTFFG